MFNLLTITMGLLILPAFGVAILHALAYDPRPRRRARARRRLPTTIQRAY